MSAMQSQITQSKPEETEEERITCSGHRPSNYEYLAMSYVWFIGLLVYSLRRKLVPNQSL